MFVFMRIGLIAVGLLAPVACRTADPPGGRHLSAQAGPQAGPQASPTAAPAPSSKPEGESAGPSQGGSVQSLQSVDFKNFTYPFPHGDGQSDEDDGFTLRDGSMEPHRDERGVANDESVEFGSVSFGDVTGDNSEEAIVVLVVFTGGSAVYQRVYIYSLEAGRPKPLWAFETGDRADGGLYGVYAEKGGLVVELNGKDRVIGKNLYGGDDEHTGACCPKVFTRTLYRWDGSRFAQSGKPRVLPLPRDGDSGPSPK
jgi:hypothetical protein